MAYKAKKKDVTLQEFQAWLEGVEELQAKDWSPDATQWKLIRNKIKNIIAPVPVVAEAPIRIPVAPALAPGLPLAPVEPGSIPDFEITEPTEAAAKMLAPSTPAVPAKTPNIEPGADGKVKSAFE